MQYFLLFSLVSRKLGTRYGRRHLKDLVGKDITIMSHK